MKTRPTKNKRMAVLLTLCMALSLLPITAFANQYTHTYHTKVETTAQVTIKGADGIEIETTEVKKSGDFIEGNLSADAVQAEIARIDEEIKVQFSARGSVTMEKRIGNMVFDHFESSNIIKLDDDETGSVNKDLHVNEYQVYQITYDLIVQEAPQPASTITAAAIENAKFDYQAGDAPQATATVAAADADKYQIVYECWQQFENNNPVAAWYSDNGSHGSLPTITEFESGKKYMYFLMLKPKDGYSFSSETVITVNGEKVSAPFVGGSMYIPAVKTITMPTLIAIDVVEINDVTVSFKDGDKPVFTGKVPDGANYAYRCEWWELDSKTGAMSTDFGNFYENRITAFEAGKTYHYGVYVTTYGDVGNVRYIFTPDTKLKINGEFVNYTRYEGDESDGSDGTMWVLTDLTMTPEESTPQKHSFLDWFINSFTKVIKWVIDFIGNVC